MSSRLLLGASAVCALLLAASTLAVARTIDKGCEPVLEGVEAAADGEPWQSPSDDMTAEGWPSFDVLVAEMLPDQLGGRPIDPVYLRGSDPADPSLVNTQLAVNAGRRAEVYRGAVGALPDEPPHVAAVRVEGASSVAVLRSVLDMYLGPLDEQDLDCRSEYRDDQESFSITTSTHTLGLLPMEDAWMVVTDADDAMLADVMPELRAHLVSLRGVPFPRPPEQPPNVGT